MMTPPTTADLLAVQSIAALTDRCIRFHGGFGHGNHVGFCPPCVDKLVAALRSQPAQEPSDVDVAEVIALARSFNGDPERREYAVRRRLAKMLRAEPSPVSAPPAPRGETPDLFQDERERLHAILQDVVGLLDPETTDIVDRINNVLQPCDKAGRCVPPSWEPAPPAPVCVHSFDWDYAGVVRCRKCGIAGRDAVAPGDLSVGGQNAASEQRQAAASPTPDQQGHEADDPGVPEVPAARKLSPGEDRPVGNRAGVPLLPSRLVAPPAPAGERLDFRSELRALAAACHVLIGDPEDCEDCGDLLDRPCRMHMDPTWHRALDKADAALKGEPPPVSASMLSCAHAFGQTCEACSPVSASPAAVPASELQIAERIAREAHDGQKDTVTGAPYITHVERVVAMVDGDEAKAVAWLHDVLEDSDFTPSELHRAGISSAVVDAVIAVSRDLHESDTRTYAEYIAGIRASKNPLALAVKLADLRDHLRPNCPERLRPRYEAALKVLAGEPAPAPVERASIPPETLRAVQAGYVPPGWPTTHMQQPETPAETTPPALSQNEQAWNDLRDDGGLPEAQALPPPSQGETLCESRHFGYACELRTGHYGEHSAFVNSPTHLPFKWLDSKPAAVAPERPEPVKGAHWERRWRLLAAHAAQAALSDFNPKSGYGQALLAAMAEVEKQEPAERASLTERQEPTRDYEPVSTDDPVGDEAQGS